MNRSEVFEKVNEIFREVFEDDSIVVTDETTAADVAGWDSLTHLSLVDEIEMEFHIRFMLAEVQGSKNVGELVTALMKHLEENHIWVKTDGDLVYMGISNFAQERMKSVMFLNLEDSGSVIHQGDKFGDIESIKTVADLISPVEGIIDEVNEALIDDPDLINDGAEQCWLVKIKNASLSADLMNAETYAECKENL